MKVVFSKALCAEAMSLMEAQAEIFVANDGNPHNYLAAMRDADALVLRIGKIDADVITQSPNLKVIGRTGVGYDNVDVAAATAAGIPVVITPGANTQSVAEHTLAMLFGVAKNLCEAQTETAKGHFSIVRDSGKAFEVAGKVIGLIGLGAIGKKVALLCQAIGMQVIGYDPYLSRDQIEAAGCEFASDLSILLHSSDVVSVHVPMLPETKGLIGSTELSLMKPTAVIINCARGGIIDETALLDALNRGVIAGAGIDVFVEEPVPADNPLLNAPNLVFSPHSAAMTREAVRNMGVQCVAGCLAILRGERWPAVANPAVYDHPRWRTSE
ncbi:MAG: hydroxyacid dehydrogenase [Clostridiales bacterium]|nr:hydroxyacid dehydrogenase [Clostridiales bacterium]